MYREPFRWRTDEHNRGLWLRLCRDVDITVRKGFRVQVGLAVDLALFRVHDTVVAVSNVCPHKHEAVIAEGFVHDGTVSCPLHGWCFSLHSGEQVDGGTRGGTSSATGGGRGLRTYPTAIKGSDVWVLLPNDADLPSHYGADQHGDV